MTLGDTEKNQQTSASTDKEEMSEKETNAAVETYFAATQSGNAERWALRFADSALGQPLLTTFAAIKAQGEQFMSGFRDVGLHPNFVQISGNRASVKWTGKGTNKDGKSGSTT